MAISETLYLGESATSQDFKLVRLARACRAVWITEPWRNTLTMEAYVASELAYDTAKDKQARAALRTRMDEARSRLHGLGVPRENVSTIIIYSKPREGQIWIQLLESSPVSPLSLLPSLDTVTLGPPGASPANKDSLPEMSAGIIIDPKAKPEGSGASRTVETQVELKFKQPGRKETISLQLNIGPNGFEEAAVEAVIKEIKLKERLVGDVITEVKLKFKLAVGVEFEKKDAEQKVGDFQAKVYAKLKASLSFKLKTPIPGHKIEPEFFGYTDIAGKPGVGVSIMVFEF